MLLRRQPLVGQGLQSVERYLAEAPLLANVRELLLVCLKLDLVLLDRGLKRRSLAVPDFALML